MPRETAAKPIARRCPVVVARTPTGVRRAAGLVAGSRATSPHSRLSEGHAREGPREALSRVAFAGPCPAHSAAKRPEREPRSSRPARCSDRLRGAHLRAARLLQHRSSAARSVCGERGAGAGGDVGVRLLKSGDRLRVGVERDRHRGVPQALRHDLGVDAGRKRSAEPRRRDAGLDSPSPWSPAGARHSRRSRARLAETTRTGAAPCATSSRTRRADAGIRTPDPFITSEVLYQLSYVGADVPR